MMDELNSAEQNTAEMNAEEPVMKEIKVMDHAMILALLVVGIQLLWTGLATFTMKYHDIGINTSMMLVVNCVLAVVSIILSLASVKRCAMRFSMMVFFWSLTCFVTNFTPFINEQATEVAFGVAMIAISGIAFLKNREWLMGISSLLIVAELLFVMFGISNPTTILCTYGVAGVMITVYACGLFLFLDLGKDYIHVVTESITDDSSYIDPGNIFETISNATFGILLFVAGLTLVFHNITHDDCAPLAILSVVVIVIAFFGMNRGYIPEGVTLLIVALYFLCQTITVLKLDITVLGLLAFVCAIPLFVVLAMYYRRKDTIKMASAILLMAFFAIIALFDYHVGLGAIILIVSAFGTYCGICRMVFAEFGYTLPFYKYL